MLIVKNKRYIKKHAVGGTGIFDTLSDFARRLVSSNAVRIASNLSKAAANDIEKSAVHAAKAVGDELATSAISTAKDIGIQKGKQLIDKTSSKVLTPKSIEMIKQITGLELNTPVITQNSKDILANLVGHQAPVPATININRLLAGQGLRQQQAKAIRIKDLVKKMNTMGAGLRLA